MNKLSWGIALASLVLTFPTVSQEPVVEPTPADAPPPDAIAETVPVQPAEVAPEAPAEEPDANRSTLISEILVTAQKREEALQDVPISISAFSGDALSALGVTDTADLSSLVPGFTYSNSGFGSPVYTLRGVGFTDGSFTASSTVGVYVDEVNLPFPILTKAANVDLSRVEVLKGPQGTLYGRNTTGGAVNYIANKPTDSFQAGVDASVGRFQARQLEGYVSGPLTDTFRGRLAVFNLKSDQGWQQSHTRGEDEGYETLGEFDRSAVRGSLDWSPSEAFTNLFTVTWSEDKSDPQAPQAIGIDPQNPFGGETFLAPGIRDYPLIDRGTDDNRAADWAVSRGPQRPTVEEIRWGNDERQWMGTARSDWHLTDETTFTALGSYIDFKIDDAYIPENGFDIVNVERLLNASVKAWSGEARLSGSWGAQKNVWILGAFASNDKVRQDDVLLVDTNSAIFPNPIPTLPPTIGDTISVLGRQKADTVALFANTDWILAEAFKLTAGLRYTDEKRRYTGCTADGPDSIGVAGFPAVFNAVSISRGGLGGATTNSCFTLEPERNNSNGQMVNPKPLKEDNLSGRLSLNWTPTEESLYYVSFSRGYKSGSFPVISSSDGVQLDAVKQEQLDAYEVGAKTEWLDRSFKINGALFFYKYKDKQLLTRFVDPLFGPLPILDNAPKSEVKGGELELQYSPVRSLYVAFAGAYIETEVVEFDSIDEAGNERSFAGNEFNFTPKLTYNALLNYEPALTDRFKLMFGADYTYVDDTNSVLGADPLFAHDDYFNLNLRAGIGANDGSWSVVAWGQNVTDELQTVSIFDPGDAVARFVGMTRTYGIRLKLRFE
ncbi:MAG TPA: TonB-dependent receptor [Nevskiaceae bacterium]|nr:TonB-dependent receptor [Nevskiaceae bacterium]